jgi:hypothetical protein
LIVLSPILTSTSDEADDFTLLFLTFTSDEADDFARPLEAPNAFALIPDKQFT